MSGNDAGFGGVTQLEAVGLRWVGDGLEIGVGVTQVGLLFLLVEKVSNLYIFCFTTGFLMFFLLSLLYVKFFFEKMFKKNNRKRVCVYGQLPKGPKEGTTPKNKTKSQVASIDWFQ